MTMPPFHVHEIRRALDMADALGQDARNSEDGRMTGLEKWVLFVWLASGELMAVPQENELACDSAQSLVMQEAIQAEHMFACPQAVDAVCRKAIVEGEPG